MQGRCRGDSVHHIPRGGHAGGGGAFRRVAPGARLVRYGMDCYAYALIAAGQIDLVIEAGLQAYDVQAPIAVIEAAGGIVTDWEGRPCHDGGRVLAAANAAIHAEALGPAAGAVIRRSAVPAHSFRLVVGPSPSSSGRGHSAPRVLWPSPFPGGFGRGERASRRRGCTLGCGGGEGAPFQNGGVTDGRYPDPECCCRGDDEPGSRGSGGR